MVQSSSKSLFNQTLQIAATLSIRSLKALAGTKILGHTYDNLISEFSGEKLELEGFLFVVSRNKKGHTRTKEIGVDALPVSSDDEPLKLSEAMLRGYIGGLPKGF
jgi:hypothetical protein